VDPPVFQKTRSEEKKKKKKRMRQDIRTDDVLKNPGRRPAQGKGELAEEAPKKGSNGPTDEFLQEDRAEFKA